MHLLLSLDSLRFANFFFLKWFQMYGVLISCFFGEIELRSYFCINLGLGWCANLSGILFLEFTGSFYFFSRVGGGDGEGATHPIPSLACVKEGVNGDGVVNARHAS